MINTQNSQILPFSLLNTNLGYGFLYNSEFQQLEMWKSQSHCQVSEKMFEFIPIFGADKMNVSCQSYQGCNNGSVISSCHYDANHGEKNEHMAEQQIWWVYNFTVEMGNSGAVVVRKIEKFSLFLFVILSIRSFVLF